MPRSSKPPKAARKPPRVRPQPVTVHTCEADVPEGLERIARSELRCRFEARLEAVKLAPGTLRFAYAGNLYQLLALRTVHAVYLSRRYPIPRPRALLGDQHWRALLAQIAVVRELSPAGAYRTFHLSAAGPESSVMRRLREALAAATGLEPDDEAGDLLVRLRHPPDDDQIWEVLVRLSPRPLSTRAWRVCNREGALNAAIAHAMIFLTRPAPDEVFLNPVCGSGTLLVERLAAAPAAQVIGYDHDETALDCARRNLEAAGLAGQVSLRLGDCRSLPLEAGSVDAIAADLPFGHLVGSHEHNLELYPALLMEAARVIKPGGRCVLISHEVRLMETLLTASPHWSVEQVIRVAQGGLYPRIFALVRH